MNHAEDTKLLTGPARVSEGGEMRWDHASRAACIAALVTACSEPRPDRPGIDGEASAALMAETVFSACRAGAPQACYVLADWLHEAALDALREHGAAHDLPVWELPGRPVDLGPFLP